MNQYINDEPGVYNVYIDTRIDVTLRFGDFGGELSIDEALKMIESNPSIDLARSNFNVEIPAIDLGCVDDILILYDADAEMTGAGDSLRFVSNDPFIIVSVGVDFIGKNEYLSRPMSVTEYLCDGGLESSVGSFNVIHVDSVFLSEIEEGDYL